MRNVLVVLFLLTFAFKIEAQEDTIKILAVGDIMVGTNYPNAHYMPKNDVNPFKKVDSIFNTSDLLFGNLEGTLTDNGKNAKNCSDPSKCYSFRSPQKFGKYFKNSGFDVMSIANNHIGDMGTVGVRETMQTLTDNNVEFAGVYKKPYSIFTKDSITYGFYAVAPNKDCIKINNYKKAIETVKMLNDSCDVVIVSFHGGAEGTKHTHVTKKKEYYYGEDRGNVYEFSHLMIDNGADVILGHGPHVTRAIEVYKNRLIAYSLGNFCTYERFNVSGVKGYAPILELNIDKDGSFKNGKIHSAKQIDGIYPYMDDNFGAYFEMKKLTNQDFINHQIIFNDDDKSFSIK